DIPVIAEEEVAGGRITAVAPVFWLVDPLDGTREFAAGNDEFAVNIGLVRNGEPVLGVVGLGHHRPVFLALHVEAAGANPENRRACLLRQFGCQGEQLLIVPHAGTAARRPVRALPAATERCPAFPARPDLAGLTVRSVTSRAPFMRAEAPFRCIASGNTARIGRASKVCTVRCTSAGSSCVRHARLRGQSAALAK
ncbi:MAG: hypothetical protein J0H99_28275, partial [Rhodospirillales bacterium]|nr:hypothetical protein [Rhodospirillales bacterium]